MKRFLLMLIGWGIIFAAICSVEAMFRVKYTCPRINFDGKNTIAAIRNSKRNVDVRTLILGESVAGQLYPAKRYHGEIYSLTSTAAIAMAGQYFLLHNFVDSNREHLPEEVVLFCSPYLFKATAANPYFYQHFLKQFYNSEYISLMTPALRSYIDKVPFAALAKFPPVSSSNYIPRRGVIPPPQSTDYKWFEPDNAYYLEQIIALCRDNGIIFRLASTPLSQSGAQRENLDGMLMPPYEFSDSALIEQYIGSIRIMDDSLFSDEFHFKAHTIPEDYLGLQK